MQEDQKLPADKPEDSGESAAETLSGSGTMKDLIFPGLLSLFTVLLVIFSMIVLFAGFF